LSETNKIIILLLWQLNTPKAGHEVTRSEASALTVSANRQCYPGKYAGCRIKSGYCFAGLL
jgi:hypothetical protein